MKKCLALIFALACILALTEAARIRRDDKYTTKYDNINLDDILKSDRLLGNYIKCLLETGKCTAEGNELKLHIADALQTDCSKCSEVQKAGAKKVIGYLYNKKNEDFKKLEAKYDQSGTYLKKYEAELKKASK